MRTRKNRRFTQEIVALAAVLATASAAADVVYDAGAALRENCRSGVHANPYTDVNGGKWSWLWRANVTDVGAQLAMPFSISAAASVQK